MLHRSPATAAEPPTPPAQAATEPDGPVTISRQLFDFLMGADALDGVHFGEDHPDERGRFWWRQILRAADCGGAADMLIGDIEKSIEPIRHWYDTLDHEPRPLVDVVTDMVFDIKADRNMLTERLGQVRALQDHIREQAQHCQTRINDGADLGAAIWRLALEDVVRESGAVLATLGKAEFIGFNVDAQGDRKATA
ncbi:hypothetical protein [Sphingopyxis sp.]|jgi:hypothetical protein|uniref:hypothetical protein n=1 Tax=Sphingopyxis sp. TaxID=1908224 RepID=UPI003F6EE2AB